MKVTFIVVEAAEIPHEPTENCRRSSLSLLTHGGTECVERHLSHNQSEKQTWCLITFPIECENSTFLSLRFDGFFMKVKTGFEYVFLSIPAHCMSSAREFVKEFRSIHKHRPSFTVKLYTVNQYSAARYRNSFVDDSTWAEHSHQQQRPKEMKNICRSTINWRIGGWFSRLWLSWIISFLIRLIDRGMDSLRLLHKYIDAITSRLAFQVTRFAWGDKFCDINFRRD